MLIIPIEQKLDSSRPPLATVLLIILNCLVFFGYQSEDYLRMEEAVHFYQENCMLEYEAGVYGDYLKEKDFDRYKDYNELEPGDAAALIVQDVEFTHYLNREYYPKHTNAGLVWLDARRQLDGMVA